MFSFFKRNHKYLVDRNDYFVQLFSRIVSKNYVSANEEKDCIYFTNHYYNREFLANNKIEKFQRGHYSVNFFEGKNNIS